MAIGGGIGQASSSGLPLSGGTLTGSLTLPAAGTLDWATRAVVSSPQDGTMQVTLAAGTVSTAVGIRLGTASDGCAIMYASNGAFVFKAANLTDGAGITFNGGSSYGDFNMQGNDLLDVDILQFSASNYSKLSAPADGIVLLTDNAGTSAGGLKVGGTTSAFPYLKRNTTDFDIRVADDSAYSGLNALYLRAQGDTNVIAAYSTAGDARTAWEQSKNAWEYCSGTSLQWAASSTVCTGTKDTGLERYAAGVLNVTNGDTGNGDLACVIGRAANLQFTQGSDALFRTVVSSFTWANSLITSLGAVTSGNKTICRIPAKGVVKNVYIIVNTQAAGTTTLTISIGKTGASYVDYIVASDLKAAANTVYGDGAAERGTNLTGYDIASYTAFTDVTAQFVSTGANLDQVTGSTGTVYIEYAVLP